MTKEEEENQRKWDESMATHYTSAVKTIDFSRGIIAELEKFNPSDPSTKKYRDDLIKKTTESIIKDEKWLDDFRKILKYLPSHED